MEIIVACTIAIIILGLCAVLAKNFQPETPEQREYRRQLRRLIPWDQFGQGDIICTVQDRTILFVGHTATPKLPHLNYKFKIAKPNGAGPTKEKVYQIESSYTVPVRAGNGLFDISIDRTRYVTTTYSIDTFKEMKEYVEEVIAKEKASREWAAQYHKEQKEARAKHEKEFTPPNL